MKLVALAGVSQSGKDTAAAHMPGWTRFAFADGLKRMATSILSDFLVVDANWADPVFKENWRMFLVGLGAGMRSVESHFWIEMLEDDRRFPFALGLEVPIIITDLRYANEAAWALARGGMVLRIERPGFGPANAEEERSFAELDRTYPDLPRIVNNSTPEQLGRDVLEAVELWDKILARRGGGEG